MLMPSISVLTIGAAIFAVLFAIDWYVSRPQIIRLLALTRTQRPPSPARGNNRAGFRKAA